MTAQQEEAVAELREQLSGQVADLEGTHQFPKQKVKLDIGGSRFTTSRSTLMAAKSSFLAAMLR